jgi:hypothetical protein
VRRPSGRGGSESGAGRACRRRRRRPVSYPLAFEDVEGAEPTPASSGETLAKAPPGAAEASPELGQCVERVMLAVRFPAPSGGDVTVGYPVLFGPD